MKRILVACFDKKVNKSIVSAFFNRHISDETTLWSILRIVENRLILIHKCSIDFEDFQRSHGICCSSFTSFQLINGKEISHSFWGVQSLFLPANRSWVSRWTLGVNRLVINGITGFFPVNLVTSLFKAETTAGSLFSHSVDLFRSLKFISWVYWKAKRRSPKVRLNRSTIPWSLWTFTFPLLILTSCYVISLVNHPRIHA